jgi:hypothetical protein
VITIATAKERGQSTERSHERAKATGLLEMSWQDQSSSARWSTAVASIKKQWREIEWRSVCFGLRECGLTTIEESELSPLSIQLARLGFSLVPLERVAPNGYGNELVRARHGDPSNFFCLVAKASRAANFARLWKQNAHGEVGSLLGYPRCCVDFFQRYWPQFSDTTWPMACNTVEQGVDGESSLTIPGGYWQTNVLLRWIGVRAVPHLPCSFDCDASAAFASSLLTECGNDDVNARLQEMLSWRTEWLSENGIATILTPELTVRTSTDRMAHTSILRLGT